THLEESKLTPAQRSYLSTSDQLIEELQAADTVVIGAPMYNFSILHSRHGSTRSYGSGRPLATGQTALRAFWERRKSSSSLPAGVPMKRAAGDPNCLTLAVAARTPRRRTIENTDPV